MPTYEYRCESCGNQMEIFARMSDPAPAACDTCGGGELTKLLFPVAVHYKGSGFYSTDYGGKRSTGPGEGSGSTSSDTTPPSSGGTSDSTSSPSTKGDSSSSGASSSPD